MQDDQAKPVDGVVKSDESSSEDTSKLSLAGNPSLNSNTSSGDPAQSDNSIPDPALEALSQKEEAPTSAPESTSTDTSSDSQPVTPVDTTASDANDSTSSLDPIKKEALQKLEPLVNELDLHPEEKYRALMMIIQATDNKELVNEAYQAADKIEDSKTRAQALLSIVNEIEYFKNKDIASSNQ